MGSETRARLALGGLLAASLMSFELLFDTDGYVGPALLACVFAMAVGAVARRFGAGPFLTLEISLAMLFWYLAIIFQAGKTFYGLPTPGAATGLARLVAAALEASVVDYAPIPGRAGYVVMIAAGFWVATTIGEIAVFRWRRPVVASLMPLALFSVAMITGTGSGGGFFLTLFLIALLTFWATESSHRLRSWGRWVTPWDHRPEREPQQVTSHLARRMGASCIAVTLVAPVFLPTIGEGWLPWRNDTGEGPGDGGGGGEVNLLVDIAPQLLEQSDVELFTVRAEEAAYWRLASLVRYDGRYWHESEAARESAEGASRAFDRGTRDLLVQDYEINGLDGRFLPAAVEPVRVEGASAAWDAEEESVDLEAADDIAEGMTYRVTSAVARATYQELAEAEVAPSPDRAYLETGGITPEVRALLEQWTSGARTPFEQLVAIQNKLRSAEFTYREDVEGSESDDYLADFLLETKAGFCQQFSTAFALLARELGMPARISVGFLPGSADASGTAFTVRGTDAHAWPEVKFEDYGWIAFEPTARSISPQPLYTLAPVVPNLRGGETEVGGGPSPDNFTRRSRHLDDPVGSAPAPRAERPPAGPVDDTAWQAAFARLALVILIATLAWAVVVPLLKAGRSRRRFRRAATPAATAVAAYEQFEDDAAEMFGPRAPAESVAAYSHRVGRDARGVPARTVERLGTLYELAVYSPAGVTPEQAAEAKRRARELGSALWSRATPWQKARRLFSVASLLAGVDLHRTLRRTRPATG